MTYVVFVKPITHLSPTALQAAFERFGEVKDVHIPKDYVTQRRRPFAYVKFADKHAAAQAIEALNDKPLSGKVVQVCWSSEESKTPEEMELINQERQRRKEERNKESWQTPEEHDHFMKMKHQPEGSVYERYFTVVDYPPGVGEEFTPVSQRGLRPVGERKQFYSWIYISEEKKKQILEDYHRKESFRNADRNRNDNMSAPPPPNYN